MSSTGPFRLTLTENNSESLDDNENYVTEIFPSDAGGYNLNYNSYPRPEKYTGIQGSLRSTLEIPTVFRHIFSQYKAFNRIQSNIFDDAFYEDVPLIISAPTGSGKTVAFELAILRTLMNLEDLNIKDFKIIYLAPIKALCHERLLDWQIKFNHLGVTCIEATGDHDVSELNELNNYKIIITTPEKWDTLTRRWKDFQTFVSEIKLFLIDEIHLVNENERGATLEVILSRMKTISSALKYNKTRLNDVQLRFVAVSATLPNIEDVAVWIGGTQAKYYKMPEEMRPIQLEKLVFGYPSNTYASYFRFDMSLNYQLGRLIQQYSGGRPTLIFCSTRKGVEMAANVLASSHSYVSSQNSQNINEIVKRINDTKIVKLLSKGIAYHHGGLLTSDRVLIEEYFRNGYIPVLLCTSTLATGVNLPAHLVILKSTQVYSQKGTEEYPESLIFQMIGRAGRPQYDNSGVAIIMTQNNKIKLYENMVSGVRPIESNLHKHLPEHLNAEIVLRTITDLGIAVQWIKSTFLYVRAIQNPSHYGFASGLNKEKVEQKLEELCLITINSLEKHMLLTKDQLYGLTITSTVAGTLMARCYLNFNTMKIFQRMTGHDGLTDLMLLISNCYEFNEFRLRVSDKRYLNELNSSKSVPLRFPVKGKVKTISDKIFILLQAVFGNITCTDLSLYQETTKIIRIAEKISKALVQYVSLTDYNLTCKQFKTVYSALILSKCCVAKMWENSPFVSKQLSKIGNTYSKLLVEAGKTGFESIYESSARELETILHRAPPFGNLIHEAIGKLPYFNIDLILINTKFCRVKVRQTNKNYLMGRNHYEKIAIIVGDSMNNLLFFKENISFFLLDNKEFEKNIKIVDSTVELITAYVIHSTLVGLDKSTHVRLIPIPSESQEAFKLKKSAPKKSIPKTSTIATAPLQPIELNSCLANKNLNKNHENHHYDKDQNDDNFVMISSQQIFNKCRDQGIDHDRNINLNKTNTTCINDGSTRSSSPIISSKKKFVKKSRISKMDFNTTIVPSQSQNKLVTQELDNETNLNDDGNRIYRIVEILEKQVDTDQTHKLKNKCFYPDNDREQLSIPNENSFQNWIDDEIMQNNLNVNTSNDAGNKNNFCDTMFDANQDKNSHLKIDNNSSLTNREVFISTPIVKSQKNITNEPLSANNLFKSNCFNPDDGREQFCTTNENNFQNLIDDVIMQNYLNFNSLNEAVTPVNKNDFKVSDTMFDVNPDKNSHLKIHNSSSLPNREVFQRNTTNEPLTAINLLRSICDRDAFNETSDILTRQSYLNASQIEDDTIKIIQNETDCKLLLTQTNFMAERESPSPSSKESNICETIRLNTSMVKFPYRTLKDKLEMYAYKNSKKPKNDNTNCSIMNFFNNNDADNKPRKAGSSVPLDRTTPSSSSLKRFYGHSPVRQGTSVKNQSPFMDENANYKTPQNQKIMKYSSPSPNRSNQELPMILNCTLDYLAPCQNDKDFNSQIDESSSDSLFEINDEIINDDCFKIFNTTTSLFSQNDPKDLETWEKWFDLESD